MSEITDDLIQQSLEAGGPLPVDLASSGEKEVEVYRVIFEGLKREPFVSIRPDFSAMVIQKIKTKDRIGDIGFYSLIAMITVAGMAGIYYVLELLDKESANQYVAFAVHYKWILIYVLCSILIVQYLDQKISRRRSKNLGPAGFIS
jgi:hypothetical protein